MVIRCGVVEPTVTDRIDRQFHALADPTRRDILRLVLSAEQSVTALAARYPMSFAAVQKHVAVLERAQLVHKRRHGREQLVGGDIDALGTVNRLLDHYAAVWRSRVHKMDELLTASETEAELDAAKGVDSQERNSKEEH